MFKNSVFSNLNKTNKAALVHLMEELVVRQERQYPVPSVANRFNSKEVEAYRKNVDAARNVLHSVHHLQTR